MLIRLDPTQSALRAIVTDAERAFEIPIRTDRSRAVLATMAVRMALPRYREASL